MAERQGLLALAREAIRSALDRREPVVPQPLPAAWQAPAACFVTLHLAGQLRGCIGTLTPREPLWKAVLRYARAAAFEDHRFSPVTAEELDALHVEISRLTEPIPLEAPTPEALLQALVPGRDGVILQGPRPGGGSFQATFLPQVWAQLPQAEAFLDHLSRKAGCPGLWRQADTTILTYLVEAFEE